LSPRKLDTRSEKTARGFECCVHIDANGDIDAYFTEVEAVVVRPEQAKQH
jgi:hypothetical protein